MNDDMNNELNDQELTRVSNALDALQQHNEQPTTNAWEAIMEESTTRSRRISRRTGFLSAAAAAAVIIAITGTALAVASNGGSKEGVKTVDKKKKDPVATSTTQPLTEEQQLLKDTVILTYVPTGGEPGGDNYAFTVEARDGLTGRQNKKFNSFISQANLFNPTVGHAGGNTLSFVPGASPSCDDFDTHFFNMKTGVASKMTGNNYSSRRYSPSGNKYAEISSYCPESDSWETTMTIVDTKTGAKRVIKAEPFVDVDGNPAAKVTAAEVMWVDDNQILLGTAITTANGLNWTLETLDKPISLNNAVRKEVDAPSSSDGQTVTNDVIKIEGQVYAVISEDNSLYGDENGVRDPATIRVLNLTTGKDVWSKSFDQSYVSFGSLTFGNDINTIYGSVYQGDSEFPFIYDQKNDKDHVLEGSAIFLVK